MSIGVGDSLDVGAKSLTVPVILYKRLMKRGEKNIYFTCLLIKMEILLFVNPLKHVVIPPRRQDMAHSIQGHPTAAFRRCQDLIK